MGSREGETPPSLASVGLMLEPPPLPSAGEDKFKNTVQYANLLSRENAARTVFCL
jgi:hypothetical protein